jgi:hypothetical protein
MKMKSCEATVKDLVFALVVLFGLVVVEVRVVVEVVVGQVS